MARQPKPAFRLYDSAAAPRPDVQPLMRNQDVSSGDLSIASSFARLGQAVENLDARMEQQRMDDARIDVTKRMAEFRRDANQALTTMQQEAPDGWRDLQQNFGRRFGELRNNYLGDPTLTPEARAMFEDQALVFEQSAMENAFNEETRQRGLWQADTVGRAIEAAGAVLITNPEQYPEVLADGYETAGTITDPNLRRDATERMEESYSRYAVSGLIERDPRAALAALEAEEREGPYANLSASALATARREAQAEIDRRHAVYVSQLRDRMSLEADMLDLDMPVANPTSVATVRAAMGDAAARAWGMRLRVAEERSSMRNASVPDLLAAINEGQDNSSIEARAGQVARQRAAREQLESISRDPMAHLLASGQVPDTPDLDQAFAQAVQNPAVRGQGSWQSFLRTRAAAAVTAAQQRGVPARVFTEDEANGIAGRLRSLTPTQQASVLSQMRTAMGADSPLYEIALAQITPGGGASRVAGHYVNAPNGGNVIAGRILEGQSLIAGTRTPEGERSQRFTLPAERDLRRVFSSVTGSGAQNAYAGLPEADAADFAAFQALYASEAARAGRYDGRLDDTIARRAANQIVNKTQWSGRNVLMPPGFTRDSFHMAVNEGFARVQSRGGDLEGRQARDFDLAPLGNGLYRLQVGDDPALDAQGRQVVVSVRR